MAKRDRLQANFSHLNFKYEFPLLDLFKPAEVNKNVTDDQIRIELYSLR